MLSKEVARAESCAPTASQSMAAVSRWPPKFTRGISMVGFRRSASHSSQRIGHAQAHGRERRKNAGHDAKPNAEANSQQQVAGWKEKHRQHARESFGHCGNNQTGHAQTERSAQKRHQAGLRHHQNQDLSAREPERLQYSQFSGPLAHSLVHGVAGNQKDREENRA